MSFLTKSFLVLAGTFFLTLGSTASADIIIDGYTDEENDRFTNSSSFIATGLDFSGVGRRESGPNQSASSTVGASWGTLISPNVVIGAAHAIGSPFRQYEFYADNDPNSTRVTRTEISRTRLSGTDLILVVLNARVDPFITHYNFAQEALSADPFDADTNSGLFNAGSFQDEVAYVFGISPADSASTAVDQAVGRNRVSGYIENIDFQGNVDNDSLLFARDFEGDDDFVEHETLVQGGDSGAPVFIERNGELLLIGVNSFRDTDNTFSGITYTGNLAEEINSFITLNAVPEPSSVTLLVIAGLGAFVRRRRLD